MELIVDFKEKEWLAVLIDDDGEMKRFIKINPNLDVNDIVCGKITKKSQIANNFFFEYQKGVSGLLIKAKGYKEGDKVFAKMLRKEEPPFKSAKFAPSKPSKDLSLYEIEKGQSILLSIIDKYNIDKIICNPSEHVKIFNKEVSLKQKPFDNIILDEIASLSEPVVNLNNGARIVIEKTCAFTAIDVDSGSSTDTSNEINMLASKEILRQLELREIYGQIVIDFIGHSFDKKLFEVIKYLKSRNDIIKFISLTRLNLIELIRERK